VAVITGNPDNVARRRAELLSQPYLTVSEATELISLDRHTIYEMIRSGELKGRRFGRKWFLETGQFK